MCGRHLLVITTAQTLADPSTSFADSVRRCRGSSGRVPLVALFSAAHEALFDPPGLERSHEIEGEFTV